MILLNLSLFAASQKPPPRNPEPRTQNLRLRKIRHSRKGGGVRSTSLLECDSETDSISKILYLHIGKKVFGN